MRSSPAGGRPLPPPIPALWALLRQTPTDTEAWQQIRQAYAKAGLLPQQAYADQQWRRLQSSAPPSTAPPSNAPFSSAPPSSAPLSSAPPSTAPLSSAAPLADAGSAPPHMEADSAPDVPHEPAPGTPTASGAESLLLQPQLAAAQTWAAALGPWLATCPGDWLSWLYLARLRDGLAVPSQPLDPGAPSGKALEARDPAAERPDRQRPEPESPAADSPQPTGEQPDCPQPTSAKPASPQANNPQPNNPQPNSPQPTSAQADSPQPASPQAASTDTRSPQACHPDATNPEAAIQRAQALEPIAGESLHWLGLWRLNGGDHQGAIAALAQLVDLRPLRHGSMLYLGEALLRAGNRPAAEAAFTRASASSNPAFLRLLAQRVYQHNYWQEAIAVLQRALELAPDQRDTLLALARLHWEVYELSAAEGLCQRILALDPTNGEVRYLLNALPGRRGDAAAHLAAVEAHYDELNDPSSRLASSIAMASLYVDTLSPEQVAERHRQLCAPIEAATVGTSNTSAGPAAPAFTNRRDPDRPLRIGLVSGDFHRQHPVNLFMLPLLERLDPQQFPTTVFHTGTMHDEDTVRARHAAGSWIEAGQLSDPALQQRILAERIDILIDLAGHTSSHRLGVFALGAAPVQATFLGYPHSTGLSRLDWLIGDPVVAPAEHAHLFSEGIAQLPGSVFCWSPVDSYPLPLPRPAEAPLVLGSFNNIMKLSPRTIALWAAVLRDLPEAQLLLKAPSLGDASVIARFRDLFTAQGIGAERLRFEGPEALESMMQRYSAIDIALDPTPYNGGTTTLQALWMGVPVISLAGGNFVSRMGASFLTALGRSDWIATDDAHYHAIARELAAQLPLIREGRAALRRQMAGSGLSDRDRYAGHFQQLLRRMWQHHCRGDSSRLLAAQP